MKKIAFLAHIDINLYLFRLPIMKILVEAGWEVYAIVPKGEYSYKFKDYGIKHIDYIIERKSLNPLKEIKTILHLKERLEEIKPDILHTFTVKPNIYGNIAGKLASVPVIINTVTGLGSFFIDESLKAKIIRNLILVLYKVTFNFSDAVIFQNQDDLNFFVQKGILPGYKAYLIKGSGIDTSLWKPVKKEREDIIKIITVGRLLKHKGIEEFIKVAEILKNEYGNKVEFIIIGDFYDGNPYSIDRNILKNAVKNKIISYYNWLPIEKVKEFLGNSDIFALLSYREGLPRTGIEALALGLPVITSNVTGCKEIIDDGENGFLVDYKNISDIVKKLKELIDNYELREKMSLKSRKKAEEEFDTKVIIKKYMDLYEQLIRDKRIK